MILSCQNLSKAFNEKPILKDVSFHIEEHDKAAIVGINGVGKTTLLRIIVGELPADSGIVTLKKEASFGYLAQNQNVNSENTIYEELLSVKAPVIAMEKQLREKMCIRDSCWPLPLQLPGQALSYCSDPVRLPLQLQRSLFQGL